MLYKVNVPLCREHLFWIVALQRRFLSIICDPATTADLVTDGWVASQLPEIADAWVRAFCCSKDKIPRVGRSVISHMKVISGGSETVKKAILTSFEHDVKLLLDIEQGDTVDYSLHGLTRINDDAVSEAVRGLLETFYNPQFYNRSGKQSGYTITQGESAISFHKDIYLRQFDDGNADVAVCPLCDGPRIGAQVDHVYPKSLYPFLSCHPLNLVPVCFQCNKIGAKGDTPPLDHDDDIDPMQNWFHPYLQPLLDWAQLEDRPDAKVFRVGFSQTNDSTEPQLMSEDQTTIARLKNLDDLVKLTRVWKQVLSQAIREQQRNIRRLKYKAAPYIDENMLKDKLKEWSEDRRRGIGLDSHAILFSYYYEAVQENASLFDELWVYYNQST